MMKPNQDKSTPRPWITGKDPLVDPNWTCIYEGEEHIACINDESNAQMIVHRVNHYEELVEACKAAINYDERIEGHAWQGKNFVEDNTLDKLYENWITKAKQALQNAGEL